jgi:O-antigen ligase
MLIWQVLGGLAAVCAAGIAIWFPPLAVALWMMTVEATPDLWQSGGHETLIGAVKGAGVALVLLLGLRFGWRRDRYNPGFAFIFMFVTGLVHGLYPGLGFVSSLRSLIGSAGPFAFSFVKTGEKFRDLVTRMAVFGPLVNIAVGAMLSLKHIHALYFTQDGALRLAGAGEPAFLGGFALIAVYAGLFEILRREDAAGETIWPAYFLLAINVGILLLSGARTPLALAAVLIFGMFLLRRRVMALAASGALVAVAVLFAGQFSFIRAVNLVQGGQAESLSNRNLIWPHFEAAIAASPWVGWGLGAGKEVVPPSGIAALIGTTAAHNEYLRVGCEGGGVGVALLMLCMGLWAYRGSKTLPRAERWLMRLVFVAFAVHSATDNTLIATTSSVLFIWTSAVFSAAAKPFEEAA